MERSENRLNFSCETFALIKSSIFISSFPSYIIFGKTFINRNYEEKESFKVHFSEAYKILVNLLYIGSFLQSDLEFSKGSILKRETEQYLWSGQTILINEESEKIINFFIETNGCKGFELSLTVLELNNFIYLFNRCLLSCLCLKELEEEFISFVIENNSCERILLSKTDKNIASEFIEQFLGASNLLLSTNKSSLRETLRYYNDTVLIIKQLNTIYVPEESNSALILADS